MSLEQSRLYSFTDDKNNGIPITASRMDAELNQDITALNQKVIIKATAPSSPIAGMLWLDSTNKLLKQYRNSEWVVMGVVHIGISAPSTPQTGDIWVDTANSLIKFYDGATQQVVGFIPTTPPAIGTTTPAAGKFTTLEATTTLKIGTTNQGDILYDNGTSIVRLTPGTAGKVLKSQGSAANPIWDYPSGQVGAPVSKTIDTAYQAATDGWVTFFCRDVGNGDKFELRTDASNPPTTVYGVLETPSATTAFSGQMTALIKKNDYYKVVTVSGTASVYGMYFVPLGS